MQKKSVSFIQFRLQEKYNPVHWIYALLLNILRLCFYCITIVLGYNFIQVIDKITGTLINDLLNSSSLGPAHHAVLQR